eukprot:13381526-Alexandrium_andersonii.AAC.1
MRHPTVSRQGPEQRGDTCSCSKCVPLHCTFTRVSAPPPAYHGHPHSNIGDSEGRGIHVAANHG